MLRTRGKEKVQLVAGSQQAEKATYRAKPAIVVLEKGMACEFSVFATPHCTCAVNDALGVVVHRGDGKTFTKIVSAELLTSFTAELRCNDSVCERQVGTFS